MSQIFLLLFSLARFTYSHTGSLNRVSLAILLFAWVFWHETQVLLHRMN